MKKIWLAAMVGSAILSGTALADDAYPRSAELVAAQTELDALKALGPRNAECRGSTTYGGNNQSARCGTR
jgi:hypothetical protein